MDLTEEYTRQATWRNWDSYLEKLPVKKNDFLLDLGCGTGAFTKLLSLKAAGVTGIDINDELLQEARKSNLAGNVSYIRADLNSLQDLNLPQADGIWTSFVPAYFPDFTNVLRSWLKLLKPGGWIAIVEMSGLFSHRPLKRSTADLFKNYYERQCKNKSYDFQMGSKIHDIILSCGLSILHEENKYDRELTFNGPAEPQILQAWEARFERMYGFMDYLGEESFKRIKSEFLDCLTKENHESDTLVKFIVARS
jgi:ubiquinone/menaquinone biosynthesis C-methylase UbiE